MKLLIPTLHAYFKFVLLLDLMITAVFLLIKLYFNTWGLNDTPHNDDTIAFSFLVAYYLSAFGGALFLKPRWRESIFVNDIIVFIALNMLWKLITTLSISCFMGIFAIVYAYLDIIGLIAYFRSTNIVVDVKTFALQTIAYLVLQTCMIIIFALGTVLNYMANKSGGLNASNVLWGAIIPLAIPALMTLTKMFDRDLKVDIGMGGLMLELEERKRFTVLGEIITKLLILRSPTISMFWVLQGVNLCSVAIFKIILLISFRYQLSKLSKSVAVLTETAVAVNEDVDDIQALPLPNIQPNNGMDTKRSTGARDIVEKVTNSLMTPMAITDENIKRLSLSLRFGILSIVSAFCSCVAVPSALLFYAIFIYQQPFAECNGSLDYQEFIYRGFALLLSEGFVYSAIMGIEMYVVRFDLLETLKIVGTVDILSNARNALYVGLLAGSFLLAETNVFRTGTSCLLDGRK